MSQLTVRSQQPRMNLKLENIKELDSLPPFDRELVIQEYQKEEHPFQIEINVLSIVLGGTFYLVVQKYFEIRYRLNGYELFSAVILVVFLTRFVYRLIEYNFIAPRIIKKIIYRLNEIKENRPRF